MPWVDYFGRKNDLVLLVLELVWLPTFAATSLCLFLHFHTTYALLTTAESPTRHDAAIPIHAPTPSALVSATAGAGAGAGKLGADDKPAGASPLLA